MIYGGGKSLTGGAPRNFHDRYEEICKKAKEIEEEINHYNSFQDNTLIISKNQELIKLATENNCPVLLSFAYFRLGSYLMNINQYANGYKYLLKSMEMIDDLEEKQIQKFNIFFDYNFDKKDLYYNILFNISTIEIEFKEYDKARAHFMEILDHYKRKGKEKDEVECLLNLNSILVSEKKYTKAKKGFKEILHNYSMQPVDSALTYYNIAIAFAEEKIPDSSCYYVNKAIDICQRINDQVQLAYLYDLKADVSRMEGNYEEEQEYLKETLERALVIHDYDLMEDVYLRLIHSEMLSGKTVHTLNWLKNYRQLIDSLKKSRLKEAFEKVRVEEKLNKQILENRNQLALLESHRKNNRLIFWLFLVSAITIVLMVYSIITTRKNNFKKIKLIEEKLRTKTAELLSAKLKKELRVKELETELTQKNREAVLMTMIESKRIQQKQKIINFIRNIRSKSVITKSDIDRIIDFINQKSIELEKKQHTNEKISNIDPGFLHNITKDFPSLTKTELKVLSYIRIGLETKEIAELQMVTTEAVRKMRYRIRKKLGLDPKSSLEQFIMKY